MTTLLLASLTLLTLASANIVVPYVQPTCDYITNNETCLNGQVCVENNTCIPIARIDTSHDAGVEPRPNGRCGRDFDDAPCDPNGPYGPCCSRYGYCDDTPQHCLVSNGCQLGCTIAGQPTSRTSNTIRTVSTVTESQSEPVIGPGTSTASAPTASEPVTTDGTCGATNGGTVCGNWPLGSCCSTYGFCGNTSAHCGKGCQSGPCNQAPVPLAPSASPAASARTPGSFNVEGDSGVPAMHAALLPNGKVVFLDKIEDYTHLNLSSGYYAYSSEYDPETNSRVGLAYKTNAFCSGGSFLHNGTLLNVGGNAPLLWLDPTVGDGFQGIRYLTRTTLDTSLDGQAWQEPGNKLDSARWYASVQTLPDGTLFVASGSKNGLDPTKYANNNPTYEILNADGITQGQSITMDLLVRAQPYYMYPFIHLLRDGTLFIFTSKSGEIFDVESNTAATHFPELPGSYRTYPNTGGSVLLPLSSTNDWNPDIIICGGGDYQDITSSTDPSCGRIKPLDENAQWEMDAMPEGRGMVEGTLLPDGTVLWVNGCGLGAEGFGLATDPTEEVLLYDPAAALGRRWSRGANSAIPRLYHSVALLLLDGTLMIAGSNPVQMPVLTPTEANPYVTEFRVQIYTPPYLSDGKADQRPLNVRLSSTTLAPNSETFAVTFWAPTNSQDVKIAFYHGGFVTHGLHMSHRMLFLDNTGWAPGAGQQYLTVTMPPSSNIAPPGPFVIYVTVDGVPSVGQFVMVGS